MGVFPEAMRFKEVNELHEVSGEAHGAPCACNCEYRR